MALNLKAPPKDEGPKMVSSEVVREVARKYAERHDLCAVVDEALAEMGVNPVVNDGVEFFAIVNIPHLLDLSANPEDLVGLTPEQEKQYVLDRVKATRYAAMGVTHLGDNSPDFALDDYNLHGQIEVVEVMAERPSTTIGGITLPPGWYPRFTSSGAAIHLAYSTQANYAVCGTSVDYPYDGRRVTGICRRCSKRVS